MAGVDDLDVKVIQQLVGDLGAEIVLDLLQAYVADVVQRQPALREAKLAGDLHNLERVAHTIKGMASNLGIDRVSNLSKDIVVGCRTQQGAQALALVDDLDRAIDQSVGTIASLDLDSLA